MKSNNGDLSFQADLDNDRFRQKIQQTENSIRGLSDTTLQSTSKMDSAFRNLSALAGGVFAFAGAQQFISDVVRVRGEFQGLEIAFKTMLGSKEKADKLMAEAIDLAAKTPFTLQDVASGAKSLLAYGSGAEGVAKEIQMMGDVASGVGAPLNDLIYLYGTLRAQGRATTIDIRQFAGRGIPIYEELSKVVGVSTKELKTWIESGKIGFAEVEKAFQNMTGEGGMFFNLMEEQSKSVTGRISNLQDAWSRMLNEIGKSNEGVIYGAVAGLNNLVENYKEIGSVIASLVTIYGSYKAATMAILAIEKVRQAMMLQTALAGKALSTWEALHAVLLSRLSKAQSVLNKTMLANPYIAVGAALAGIVTYLILTREKTDDLTEAQKEFKSEAEDVAAKSKVLFDGLKRTTEGTTDRKKAIEAVNAEYGQYLENLLTESSTLQEIERAERLANVAMVERLANESKTKDLIEVAKKQRDILLQVSKAGVDAKEFLDYVTQKDITQFDRKTGKAVGGTFKSWGNQVDLLVTNYTELINTQSDVNKKYDELTRALIGTPISLGDKPEKSFTSVGDKIEDINKQISDLETKKNALPEFDTSGVTNYNTKIDALKNKLAILKGENKGDIYPMGSPAYWEKLKVDAEKALQSLAPDDKDLKSKTQKYIGEIQKAQENIDKLEFNLKPFDDQLEYRRQQYDLYFKWVQHYGKATADKQFTDLIGQGETFASYLEKQKQSLEAIKEKTPQQQQQLLTVTIEIEKLQSPEAQLESFRIALDKTRKEASTLTDYLTELNKAQATLLNDFSPAAVAKQDEVDNQIKATQETLTKQYDQMLTQLQAFYDQYKAIKRKSSAELASIQQRVDTGIITPEQGQIEMQVVYTGDKQAIDKLQSDIDARVSAFEQFTGSLGDIAKQQIDGFVSQVNDIINIPELDKVRTDVLNQIKQARDNQNTNTEAGAEKYKTAVQGLAQNLIAAGGDAEILGKKIKDTFQSIEAMTTGTSLVKIDLAANTDEALGQLNMIIDALDKIEGVRVDVVPGDTTSVISQIQAAVSEVMRVKINADPQNAQAAITELLTKLNSEYGISISADGKDFNTLISEIRDTLAKDYAIEITAIDPQVQAKIEAIKLALSTQFGIEIKAEGTDVATQIEAIKAAIEKNLAINIDDTKAKTELGALLVSAQNVLSTGVILPVSINDSQKAGDLLAKYKGYTQQRYDIEKSYSDDKKVLEDALNKSTTDSQRAQIQDALSQRKIEYAQQIVILNESLGSYEEYYDTIQRYGKQSVLNAIKNLEAQLKAAKEKYGEQSDEYQKLQNAIGNAKKALAGSDFSNLAKYMQIASDAARIFSTDLADSLNSTIGLVQNMSTIASELNKEKPDYGSLASAAVSIVSTVVEGFDLMGTEAKKQAELRKSEAEQLNSVIVSSLNQQAEHERFINAYYRERLISVLKINEATLTGLALLEDAQQAQLQNAQAEYAKIFGDAKRWAASYYSQNQAYINSLSDTDFIDWFLSGKPMPDYLKELIKQMIDAKGVVEDYGAQIEDTIMKQRELFSGTSVSSLSDEIVQAFKEGEVGIESFGQKFEDVMRNAVISQIKSAVITPMIEEFMAQFDLMDIFGVNGGSDRLIDFDKIRAEWNATMEYISGIWDNTESMFGIDLNGNALTMQGAVKGITEESASIIAGQFNSMRIIQFDMLSVARNSFLELVKIEYNTRQALTHLKSLDRKIKSGSDTGRQYGDLP